MELSARFGVPSPREGVPETGLAATEAAACSRSLFCARLQGPVEILQGCETGAPIGEENMVCGILENSEGEMVDSLVVPEDTRGKQGECFALSSHQVRMVLLVH